MISANDLAAMQATVKASLDQTCTIQRVTRSPDGYGGYTETWATLASVNCNVAQPTAALMQQYAQLIGNQKTFVVRLPAGQDIKRNDQLIIGSDTLRVQAVLSPRSYPTGVKVLVSEVV
jgi:head-tail adaptor